MAIVHIKAQDKDLSYQINKNPASGLTAVAIRKGYGFGWFTKNNMQYSLYFQDDYLDSSFGESTKENFNYNDPERYTNPEAYLCLINSLLSLKDPSLPQESPSKLYSITVNNIKVPRNIVAMFQKDLKDPFTLASSFDSDALQQQGIYKIVFSARLPHIFSLLEVVKLFLIIVHAYSRDSEDRIEKGQVDKYVKVIKRLDVNYHIRNIFKTRCLTPSLFKEYKSLLEQSERFKFEFVEGTNLKTRKDFILDNIDFNKTSTLVDLGAGEGKYISSISKRMQGFKGFKYRYFAIEQDKELYDDLSHYIRKNS